MQHTTKATADDPYVSAVKRLDVIFSAANDYEEGARKMRDEFVVIPRADLPEVVEDGGELHVDGMVFDNVYAGATRARRLALLYFALAEYLDAREAREAREAEAAKEAELTKRRDALATELVAEVLDVDLPRKYDWLSEISQAAVDRIIKVEDKLAKFEEAQA